ncbi:MAG: hypothetical protein A2283_09385 [Lentisphaerae bacterium RIFOXYA12_FULL_48_11]|nr:MAG: hypothetical protein A2283_09385 [Lentisphaerae bacterium RIFOXYA12_FULL_48_11]
MERPFGTMEKARDAVRELKRIKGLPPGGVIIWLRGGEYRRSMPLTLTAEDSGTESSPITWRAWQDEKVRITGGRAIGSWKPVSDPVTLDQMDPETRGKIFQADIKAQGITEYGDIGLDAAWEIQVYLARIDGQGEDSIGSAMASSEYVKSGRKVSPRLEVFFNDQPMELSRWPNDGFIKTEKVLGATEIDVRGVKGCKEGIFVYEGDRPNRWVKEKDAWVQGYWFRDWAQQRQKVESIDATKRIITVASPYHYYGYRKGQWFRGLNLLCEIDVPGEWYIDRDAGILYFWPPGPLESGCVEVSMAPGLFTLTDVSYVTIRGMLMDVARSTAVTINGGQKCRVIGCTFRNLGNHAVTIFEGKENGVIGCDMYGMGGGGIYLIGGDRKALIPAGHFAENNHIHRFGRWDRMYRPGIFMSGVGLRASHNLINDAPHAAILFGGNDHLMEFNEIHNVCYESHDCGAIYAGRSWTLRGHVMRNNYLHHLFGKDGGPCNGIYLDDLFSSAVVEGNVFYQVLRPVFIGGGRDNVIQNNVFVDCPKAMHVDSRALGWCGPHADGRIKEASEKGTIAGVRYKEPPFSTRYPQLVNLLDDEPKKPKGNIVRQNIFWQGAGVNLRRVANGEPVKENWWDGIASNIRPLVSVENNLINENPKFVDEKADNFQLCDNSPALKLGFQRIPVERIGLYNDECRASWPVKHMVRPFVKKPVRINALIAGHDLYVSPAGSDQAVGTRQAPFRTLYKAQEAARTLAKDMRGDVVVSLAPGEYRLNRTLEFTEADSGRNGFHVIYRSAGGPGKARVLGSTVLKGWQEHCDGIWKVNLPANIIFHTLYEDGRRVNKARFPDHELMPEMPTALGRYLVTVGGSPKQSDKDAARVKGPGWLVYRPEDAPPVTAVTKMQIHIFPGGKWDWVREVHPVTSIDSLTRRLTFGVDPAHGVGVGARFFLEDEMGFLNVPGEFFVDEKAHVLYYMPLGKGHPDTLNISCPVLNRMIQLRGKSREQCVRDIVFDGLAVEETDNTPPRPLWAYAGLGDGALIWMNNAERITIRNCHLKNSGRSGIMMIGHNMDNLVTGCWVEHMGLNGVSLCNKFLATDKVSPTPDRCENNRIHNTRISHVGELHTYAECVTMFNVNNNEVDNCQLDNSVRYAITLRGNTGPQYGPAVSTAFPPTRGNRFHHIHVFRCGQDGGDMGALHAANLNNPGGGCVNTFEQITVTDTRAIPSVKDIPPDGIFLDWPRMAMDQVFRNVQIVRSQGTQFRSHKPENGDSAVTENVSWKSGFREDLMDYKNIGLTADFPGEYGCRSTPLINK